MIEKPNPTVSIIIPFFNEQDAVPVLHQKLAAVINNIPGFLFELICVDDGSRDDTLQQLQALANRDDRIRIVELSRNFGKEAALTAGLDYATGAAAIPMDADLQDPPELILELLREWQNGAEVVLAKRIDRSADSQAKRLTAKLFYRLHNKLSDIQLPENVGDFRLMDRIVVDALKQLPERQRFMKGLFAWVGFKTVVISYIRPERSRGASKFSGWKLWNFAMEGFTSFSTAPLRIWFYIGLTGALLSFAYACFIILKTLINGVDVPGYASIIVVILFLGSVQLISIGLLGEYIGRIYLESKQRPAYIVRRLYK